MAKQTINVPDIGGADNVDVIEVCVAPGDVVAVEDHLITLESDKSSMEIPSTVAGKVVAVLVKEGDQVSEGSAIFEVETESAGDSSAVLAQDVPVQTQEATAPAASSGGELSVSVPDIGGAEGVDVIEICVAVGDTVSEGDSLVVLESDKSSMEIPSTASGTVLSIAVSEGVKVSEGDAILVLSSSAAPIAETAPAPTAEAPAPVVGGVKQDIAVPDIGGSDDVEVIEVCVAVGDEISEGDSIVVLESDKSSMEVPSTTSGKVVALSVKEGDKVSQGSPILTLEVVGGAPVPQAAPEAPVAKTPAALAPASKAAKPQTTSERLPQAISSPGSTVYAGPAVRRLARQLGVNLSEVGASGPKGRIAKDDVKAFVKGIMVKKPAGATSVGAVATGTGIPQVPEVDFSKFGEVEIVKMSKIHKLTANNMTRNWLNVPHVTQFDDVDITELEEFRKGMKKEAEQAGVKLTPLPFLLKACAAALKHESSFNVSLHADGEHIVKKSYVNIGVAVATPNGLMVPVIRDVDKKGLYQLAEESNALAKKARDGKLLPKDMQGGCFTISSLGAIGGKGFTPIVNAPEVAILGVSKASIQPVWNGSDFAPRQMLPLSLSYDHRAINGADAGRFFTFLGSILADIRRLTL